MVPRFRFRALQETVEIQGFWDGRWISAKAVNTGENSMFPPVFASPAGEKVMAEAPGSRTHARVA